MKITPTTAALGATVTNIDLRRRLPDDDLERVRKALVEYEVLFFPRQNLEPHEHVAFAQQFGPLKRHATAETLEGYPDLAIIDPEVAPNATRWHTDMTAESCPPMGSILQMVVVPPRGGATHWSSATKSYEALDGSIRRQIDGMQALHRSWWMPVEENVHPLVRTHPESGRKALFVNLTFTKAILGLGEQESRELIDLLCLHQGREEFTVKYDWGPGDIAFWDNRSTQHRVDVDFGESRRRGYRATIAGDKPR